MVTSAPARNDGHMSSIWTVRRSVTDHKVGGLCGGIAEQRGIDPVLVRVGCVLLALSGGIGLVLYAAGWLMIPLVGETRTRLDDTFPQVAHWPRELRLVLVAAVAIVVAIVLSPFLPFGLGSAGILAAVWYFGYYRHRSPGGSAESDQPESDLPASNQVGYASHQPGLGEQPRSQPAPGEPVDVQAVDGQAGPSPEQYQYFAFSGPATPFTESARIWQQRMRDHECGSAGPSADHDAYLASPDPVGLYAEPAGLGRPGGEVARPTSRASELARSLPAKRLRLVSVLALGLTFSGLGVASALGAHLSPTTYLAVALLIAGLTLVAAAFVGRARGILPVAVLLALATVFSAVGGTGNDRTVGDGVGIHQVSYSDPAKLPAAENWDSGRLVVDLGQLSLSRNTTFTTHVEQGTLTLLVPRGVRVQVDSSIGSGYLRVTGRKGNVGSELSSTDTFGGPNPTGPVLTVHASVDQGTLEVRR